MAEPATTIREYYDGDPRLPELLRKIDDRAGALLSGRTRLRLEP